MPVVFYKDRPPLPAPVPVDTLHDLCILGGFRFRIAVIGAAPPPAGEHLAGLDILHLEGGAFGNFAGTALEPIQRFRGIPTG